MAERAFVSEGAMVAATDEDVLECAVREHAGLVYRIAYSVLRNHRDAEDATQETFIRVLRYKKRLEGVGEAKSWLAKIAWRTAVERSRKRPEVSLSEAEMTNAITKLRSQLASVEETALGSELAGLLGSLIAVLRKPLRDVLRLSLVDELSPGEIAEVLGTSEASVRSRLFRARQILKEKLMALEGSYGNLR